MLDRLSLLARIAPGLATVARERPTSSTTVADRLEERARKGREQTAVLFEGGTRWTFGEWNEAANRVAAWARGRGLGMGDAVALLMENRPEFIAVWAGLAKLGVTTALLNTNLTGRALAHAIASSHARHLVVGSECLDRFATTEGGLEAPLEVWVARDPYAGDRGPRWPRGAEDLEAALAGASRADPDRALRGSLRAGDDLFYIYTSGTTGLPKAARFSHMRFWTTGALGAFALGMKPHRRPLLRAAALPQRGGRDAGGCGARLGRVARAPAPLQRERLLGRRARVRRDALPVHRRVLPLPPEPAAAPERPRAPHPGDHRKRAPRRRLGALPGALRHPAHRRVLRRDRRQRPDRELREQGRLGRALPVQGAQQRAPRPLRRRGGRAGARLARALRRVLARRGGRARGPDPRARRRPARTLRGLHLEGGDGPEGPARRRSSRATPGSARATCCGRTSRGLLLLRRPDRRHLPLEGRERLDAGGGGGALVALRARAGERLRRARGGARRAGGHGGAAARAGRGVRRGALLRPRGLGAPALRRAALRAASSRTSR